MGPGYVLQGEKSQNGKNSTTSEAREKIEHIFGILRMEIIFLTQVQLNFKTNKFKCYFITLSTDFFGNNQAVY
jgi:hypothetical protein